MVVRPLGSDEWHLIAERYVDEFGNAMPASAWQSEFFGVFLANDLIGFAHLEKLYHFNAIYLDKEHRNARMAEGVFDVLDASIPKDYPAIILPDKNIRCLLDRYGFRELPETAVWRKDY